MSQQPFDESAGRPGLSGLDEIKAILHIRAFRRLWIVLGFSSVGDWLGILATSTFASSLFDSPAAKGAAFGGTIAIRLVPALVLGPIAGVFADRYDRRRTMALCDTTRFVLYASIPIVGFAADTAVTITWTSIATFLVETCQMLWAPAKEASVPNLVPRTRLEKVNQLGMATTYGVTPILAGIVLSALNWLITALGFGSSFAVALFLNALTYAASASMVWFGIKEISGHRDRQPDAPQQGMFRQFLDGWRYIARRKIARGLVLGIFGAFAAAGAVIGTGQFYAKSLGAGNTSFYLLFALLFVGLAIGITGGPRIVGQLSRRRWFGLSIILATGAVGLLSLAPHLFVAAVLTVVVGAGAGMAFLNGITLLGAEIEDEMRGRVYSFIQVSVQVILLLALALSSVLVGLGSSHTLDVGPVHVSVSATRLLLFVAGVLGVFAGYAALRQMDDKPGVPLLADIWSSMRGRPLAAPEPDRGSGTFVVFEGGEGAGKSTQVVKLAAWLRVRGRHTVVTREPGATDVGARIRGLVLDGESTSGLTRVSPRAEALLYAADRAHHVATVVRPALCEGAVVVSDRYVDSSLAYQGAGRDLPADEVGWLSNWATGGLRPDLVVLLDIDPAVGLRRVARRGAADRLESESIVFHERVREAFRRLAEADPHRYLVLDAAADPDEIAVAVRERLATLLPADPAEPADAAPSSGPRDPAADDWPISRAAPAETPASRAPDTASTDTTPAEPTPGDAVSADATAAGDPASTGGTASGEATSGGTASGKAVHTDTNTDAASAGTGTAGAAPAADPASGPAAAADGGAGTDEAPGVANPDEEPTATVAARPERAGAEPSDGEPTVATTGGSERVDATPADEKPTTVRAGGAAAGTGTAAGEPVSPGGGRPADEGCTPHGPGGRAATEDAAEGATPSDEPTAQASRVEDGNARAGLGHDGPGTATDADDTTVLARVDDETVVHTRGDPGSAGTAEPDTTVLPRVDERETSVLPRLSSDVTETTLMPAVRDDAGSGTAPDAPRGGRTETTVMPAVRDDTEGTPPRDGRTETTVMPVDPWSDKATSVFPTVQEHAGRDSFDDGETMIMPSSDREVRRRKRPRRRR